MKLSLEISNSRTHRNSTSIQPPKNYKKQFSWSQKWSFISSKWNLDFGKPELPVNLIRKRSMKTVMYPDWETQSTYKIESVGEGGNYVCTTRQYCGRNNEPCMWLLVRRCSLFELNVVISAVVFSVTVYQGLKY